MGGPIRQAMPSKSNSSPKAFVSLSSPKRSTKMTDVRLTQAPEKEKKLDLLMYHTFKKEYVICFKKK